jgi:phenylalanyl-tRNA synthetase beta chain
MIPCYRTDIMHPMDLVEDIAIAHGYDKFTHEIPDISTEAGEDSLEVFSRSLRNFMVGFGFQEVVTFMMSNRKKLFTKMCLPEQPLAETENPKMEGYTVLRNNLLPGLMEVLSTNKHHPYPQNIYEVDDVVLINPETDTGANSSRRLAVVLCHAKANFSEVKAIWKSILDNLAIKFEISSGGPPCFIDGRCFNAKISEHLMGWAGEIKPEVLDNWGIELPVSALEIDVDMLFHAC